MDKLSFSSRSSLSKIIATFTQTSQFKLIFNQQIGQGQFKSTECEDIQIPEDDHKLSLDDSYEEQQFYLQGDQQLIEDGIKTYQFNSGMFMPNNLQFPEIHNQKPEVQLQKSLFNTYGFNSKYKSSLIMVDDQYLCMGIGCNVILQKLKRQENNRQVIGFGHRSQVSTILYAKQRDHIYSGSSGIQDRSQIIQWQIIKKDGKIQNLKEIRKFYLPRKSKGVGSLTLIDKYLICVDEYSLHNNNLIYLFNLSKQQSNRHEGQPIKLDLKIMDIHFQNTYRIDLCELIVVTNKGTKKFKDFIEPTRKQLQISQLKLSCLVKRQRNNYLCGTTDGYLWQNTNNFIFGPFHSGWVLKVKWIQCKNINKSFLITCGGDDQLIKIHEIDVEEWQVALKDKQRLKKKWKQIFKFGQAKVFQLNSYVTNLQVTQSNIVVFGLRDGGILVYDLTQQKVISRELGLNNMQVAYQKHAHIYKPQFNQLTRRIFIPHINTLNKKSDYFTSLNIMTSAIGSSSGILNSHQQFKCLCFALDKQNLITLLSQRKLKQKKSNQQKQQKQQKQEQIENQQKKQTLSYYPVLVQQITKIVAESKNLGSIQKKEDPSDRNKWNKFADHYDPKKNQDVNLYKLELNENQVGKPTIIKQFAGGFILGTEKGYFVIYELKTKKIIFSKVHSFPIQDIAYQTNCTSKRQIMRYYKTVAGSELHHWQIYEKKGNLFLKQISQKTKNLKQLKTARWDSVLKYGWQSKYIWQMMTYYNEINNVCVINQRYTLVSMQDGTLRIYNYPVTKQNSKRYQQYKLFNAKFSITVCNQFQFICFCKGIFLIFQLQ